MAQWWQCNTCGQNYPEQQPDGSPNFHVCPPDRITVYAVQDNNGAVITPEKREPFANRRDERPAEGLQYFEGRPFIVRRDPDDPARLVPQPTTRLIRSEGKGRTAVEAPA